MKTNERHKPVKESADGLNKFETLLNDFKIYREGKAITLTRDELYDFHHLDGAVGGMLTLDFYKSMANPEDIPIMKNFAKMKKYVFYWIWMFRIKYLWLTTLVKLKENVSNGVTINDLAMILRQVLAMLFYKTRNGIPVKVGKTFRGSCSGTKKKRKKKGG